MLAGPDVLMSMRFRAAKPSTSGRLQRHEQRIPQIIAQLLKLKQPGLDLAASVARARVDLGSGHADVLLQEAP